MIVILEGLERTGKTILAREFEKNGFLYVKDVNHVNSLDLNGFSKVNNRLDVNYNFLKYLDDQDVDVVIDRFYITELVYSETRRMNKNEYCMLFDALMAHLNSLLILTYTDEFSRYNDRDNLKFLEKDIKNESDMFMYYYTKSEIKNKYKVTFDKSKDNQKDAHFEVERILERFSNKKKYDIYLASPFFNDKQEIREEIVALALRGRGLEVYRPRENGIITKEFTEVEQDSIFKDNIRAINNSKVVLAITDEKDMGTIWEAGYAYGRGIPVVYYAETLGDNPFNVMLAKSGKSVYKSTSELLESLDSHTSNDVYKLFGKEYKGNMQ